MLKAKIRSWYADYVVNRALKAIHAEVIDGRPGDESGDFAQSLNPVNTEYVKDPYPLMSYLREHEPLHRTQTGAWALTRYDDVLSALADERLGNSPSEYAVVNRRNSEAYTCADVARNILPFIDPPQHTTPRMLVGRCFHQYLKEHPVPFYDLANEALDNIKDKKQFDILNDYATPFSFYVFCHIMGLAREDEQKLLAWSEWFLYLFTMIPSVEIREHIDKALQEFRIYIKDLLLQTRNNSAPNLVQYLSEYELDGLKLTEEQVIDNCMLLFADGIGNSDKAVATAVLVLKQNPQQLDLLLQDESLISSMVNEVLRFESPAQYIGRVARQDIEWHGQTIKKNEFVLLVLAAANRDQKKFETADSFDIKRNPNPHVSFGRSRHSCIGSPLVKQEMEAAITQLLPMLAGMEIDQSLWQWDARPGHRWLKKCPVKMND